jgi:hypothetical protein
MEIAIWFIRRSEQQQWINEGERRAAAKALKETTNALAQVAQIKEEFAVLSVEDLDLKLEEEGWFRD